MESAVLTIWCQAAAAAAWGTAGAVLVRSPGERPTATVIGSALLVGAGLQAVDSVQAGGTAMPLAAMALAFTAWLAHTTRDHRLATALAANGLRLVAYGAALLALLHWLHGVMPRQGNFGLAPYDLGVANAPIALTLLWLGARGRAANGDVRFLLVATALALGTQFVAFPQGPVLTAGLQVLAIVPLVLRRLATDLPALSVATAISGAFAMTCLVRATTSLQHREPHLAGLDDPLLVIAAMIVAFGVALLRAYRTPTRDARADAPAAPASHVPPEATASPAPAELPLVPDTTLVPSPGIQAPPATAVAPTAARGQLSAKDVVRDLRAPITSMVAAVGLLSPTAGSEERRRQLSSLQECSRQLTTALTDLDDFENLLHGSVDLAEDAYDLRRLLQNCVDEVSDAIVDRGLQARLDASPNLPRWVQGDPSRTRQLITRMLQLATQHATIGTIDVSASSGSELHVVVLHRGATMPEDGRSLGLLFCTQLALALGGELRLQPLSDSGFQMHLLLPLRLAPTWEVDLLEEDELRSAQSPCSPHTPDTKLLGKVMLVEDSRDHQLLLGRLLEKTGVQVTLADSGAVATHLAESTPFDVILLDMQLPGVDGYEIVRSWRERGMTTPVLAVTADTTHADVERCLAAGCNGHLGKPVEFLLLQRSLAMHLQPQPD